MKPLLLVTFFMWSIQEMCSILLSNHISVASNFLSIFDVVVQHSLPQVRVGIINVGLCGTISTINGSNGILIYSCKFHGTCIIYKKFKVETPNLYNV